MAYQAILFDYDGVLVDSEPLSLGVLRTMLAQRGWRLTPLHCRQLFMGQPLEAWPTIIEENSGLQIEQEWMMAYRLKRDQAIQRATIRPVPGVLQALQQLNTRWAGRLACVSAASQQKLEEQLQTLGFYDFFSPHIYSGQDAPRNKPHPDVYLKAIAGLGQGITAAQCAVIEDSLIGIRAAAAANTYVLAYTAYIDPAHALKAGAQQTFDDMHQLPALLSLQHQAAP